MTRNFENKVITFEKEARRAFKEASVKFLRNNNDEKLQNNRIKHDPKYRNLGCTISIKLHFLNLNFHEN